MNKYWQVVRTYLWRPRFWVLAFAYVLCTFVALSDASPDGRHQLARPQAVMSAVFACLTGSFLALHVRRQFGNAAALVMPGFAAPHLTVAAIASAWLWLILPGTLVLSGHWPRAALAIHAFAGILMALVAIHARAIVLILAVPVILAWSSRFVEGQKRFSTSFMLGEWPVLELTILLAAVAAHVCAFVWLRRLPRQGIAANDEFVIDASASNADLNPLNNWLLGTRDAAAERLMDARRFQAIQRWRVPVAISPVHLAVPVIIVAAFGLIGRFFGSTADWLTLAAVTTSAVLLLIPLGPWHFRRKTMHYELLRPVTRERYFRQIMAAMAVDVVVWTSLSSCIVYFVYWANMLSFQRPDERSNFMLGFLVCIWAIAVFVYGLGVATMRLPFWLPIVAGVTLIWSLGLLLTCVWIAESFWHGIQRHAHAMQPIVWFAVVSVAVGLLLARGTYRHWVSHDVP
jgi:hypothetical protein